MLPAKWNSGPPSTHGNYQILHRWSSTEYNQEPISQSSCLQSDNNSFAVI